MQSCSTIVLAIGGVDVVGLCMAKDDDDVSDVFSD